MAQLPKIPVTEWQRAALLDESQFQLIVAARQSGKSDFLAKKSITASVAPRPNLDVLLSRGERQSLEVMEKVRTQARALNVALEQEDTFFRDTSLVQHAVTFPNHNRIIALPANPDTARGYTGNIRLDEFALHKDSREIWAAAAPIATRGYQITVCSTFKGTDNKFYELAKMLGLADGLRPEQQPVRANGWSGHWVDIYMSAEQTWKALQVRIDVEALRAAIDDEEIWLQEFANVPMSGADEYIPQELVLACEDDGVASLEWNGEPEPGLCAGWDFAQKRDRSVLAVGKEIAGLAVVRGLIYLDRMTFAQQEEKGREVARAIQASDGTFSMDAGGNGAQIAETLQSEFTCVDAVLFGGAVETGAKNEQGGAIREMVKLRIARDAKRRFEERTWRLPESTKIRRALRSIKRSMSPTGNIIIDAARTEQGHGDEFWALALLNGAMAGSTGYRPMAQWGACGGAPVLGNFMEREF